MTYLLPRVQRASTHRSRRGFTMLEVITALVLLGVLALTAVQTFRNATDGSLNDASSVRLATAQAAVRATLNSDGLYPENLLEEVQIAGATAVAGDEPSTKDSEISIYRDNDGSTFVLAVIGADDSCVALFDSATAATTWGIYKTTPVAGCTARNAATKMAEATSRDPLDPSEINFTE